MAIGPQRPVSGASRRAKCRVARLCGCQGAEAASAEAHGNSYTHHDLTAEHLGGPGRGTHERESLGAGLQAQVEGGQ